MKCIDRGAAYEKPYCKRDGDYCTTTRWMWCKGIVLAIFMALSIGWFAYGIVFAYNYADDRVEVRKKIEDNRVAEMMRMDELEKRIMEGEKTIVSRWKRQEKKKETKKEGK